MAVRCSGHVNEGDKTLTHGTQTTVTYQGSVADTETKNDDRLATLVQNYDAAFRLAFESFALGTTDSPVRDGEVLELARRAGITRGSRVLEPGSGSGGVSRLLARELKCDVQGIDLTPFQFEEAQRRAEEAALQDLVSCSLGDMEVFDYEQEAYDVAMDVFSWIHVPDWQRLFSLLSGALKPGGRIVMYDAFLAPAATDETAALVRDAWLVRICAVDDCTALLEESGYRVIHTQERGRQVLDNWRGGLANLRKKEDEFLGRFGEDAYRFFVETSAWTIGAFERDELTAAQIIAEKA
jgi:cyclopropane fatty-acyl-phospholipid synthase-like methyltransferase